MNDRRIVELDLNDILPNRFQPRIKFSEDSISELADSIREHGVIQPIVVRPLGDRYEIIAGERRYKASVLAGKDTIPAIVTELNDKDSAEVALIENVQRQDLTPIEEAVSYKKILDMGYMTQEDLAEKLGKTQSTIANKLRLLNLDEEVQEALLDVKISERHARSLLKISDKEKQKEMLKRIISERLTVRRTDEEINKMMNENKNVEILDFTEETTNQQMNTVNPMNIPTSPIVEDIGVEPVVSQTFVSDVINPGFMNVEQIKNEAQDIFVEKPEVNMEALLKPTDILNSTPVENTNPFGISMETEDEDDDSAESLLKPGKFFNFTEEENTVSEAEASQDAFVQDTILEKPVMENPVVESAPVQVEEVPTVPVEPVIENNNFITNFDSGISGEQEKPTPIIPVNPEPLVQTPIAETVSTPSITIPSYSELDEELYKPVESPIAPIAEVEQMEENNIKQAIDAIRECAQKLESLGFVVETEEYDFEDMYQAIFKINK